MIIVVVVIIIINVVLVLKTIMLIMVIILKVSYKTIKQHTYIIYYPSEAISDYIIRLHNLGY